MQVLEHMITMDNFLSFSGFNFNVTASVVGREITLQIMEASGTATFQCQLDNGVFEQCK